MEVDAMRKIPLISSDIDISTKEGWNAYARESNTKCFIGVFGREPKNYEEVRECIEWVLSENDKTLIVEPTTCKEIIKLADKKAKSITTYEY